MAKKARKQNARKKLAKNTAKKAARKAKVAGKKKTPRKTAKGEKPATAKKARSKTAPAEKKPVQQARAPNKAAAKPAADRAARTRDAELRLSPGSAGLAAAAPPDMELKAALNVAAPLGDDEEKFLTIVEWVDDYFAKEKKKIKPNEPLKDTDKLSIFKLGDNGIDGMLGEIRAALAANDPRFTLTLTAELRQKCKSAEETVVALKFDINRATTRA